MERFFHMARLDISIKFGKPQINFSGFTQWGGGVILVNLKMLLPYIVDMLILVQKLQKGGIFLKMAT